MNDLPESMKQPTNVAGGEGISYAEVPSVAKRRRRTGKRNSRMRRSWKSLKHSCPSRSVLTK
jgi:hypothetical protein